MTAVPPICTESRRWPAWPARSFVELSTEDCLGGEVRVLDGIHQHPAEIGRRHVASV